MTFLVIFCLVQALTALLLAFHDWVHIPPLTDIRALEKLHSKKFRLFGSVLNVTIVLLPLGACLYYLPGPVPLWVKILAVAMYGLLTIGTIAAWWVPYFFGSSAEHKAGFAEYAPTHRFLPARGDNVVPNTFHVIMHLFIWSCLGMAVYLLVA